MYRSIIALLAVLIVLPACDDGPNDPEFQEIVISGPVVNRSGVPIPADARALVAWTVTTTDPDYEYIWGEGRVNPDGQTFQVTLSGPPPSATLNAGETGVGLIFLTTNQEVTTGGTPRQVPLDQVLGLTGQHAVIYRSGNSNTGGPAWINSFPTGYAVGVGVQTSGIFDDFAPVDAATVELIVDDIRNIEVVNWTSRTPAGIPARHF